MCRFRPSVIAIMSLRYVDSVLKVAHLVLLLGAPRGASPLFDSRCGLLRLPTLQGLHKNKRGRGWVGRGGVIGEGGRKSLEIPPHRPIASCARATAK